MSKSLKKKIECDIGKVQGVLMTWNVLQKVACSFWMYPYIAKAVEGILFWAFYLKMNFLKEDEGISKK